MPRGPGGGVMAVAAGGLPVTAGYGGRTNQRTNGSTIDHTQLIFSFIP